MTTTSQSTFTLVTRIVPIAGGSFGLREIDSFGSILRVLAGPFPDLNRLKSAAERLTHVTYVIDAPSIYTGHGKGSRQIGDRLDPQALKQAQVYVIYSLDPRFDKLAASYVEDRLVDMANKLGVPLANRVPPLGRRGLHICPNLQQLVDHADYLLAFAGFRRFEEARQNPPDRLARLAAVANLDGVRIVEREELVIPADAVIERLVHDTLKAEGYRTADERFIVLPGADYCNEMKSGLSDENRERREVFEDLDEQADLLEELPGITDRRRLRVALDCKSAPIAAKIITGEHLDNSDWEPAPLPAPGEARAA